jgi:uncharacterized protein (DUF362 family)/Pyruvate/2-oxoacid:ferredoxin oxidoreductase delta subunit
MTSEPVVLQRCGSYDAEAVRGAVTDALQPLGGMARFVSRGDRVLLKPNLVFGRAPEAAVNTHPAVVRAVGELVRDCGGTILLGDSPGVGTARKAARACGIEAAVEELGGSIVEFTVGEDATDDAAGSVALGTREMARELAEADLLLNLPKFKTHVLAGLTLAVKNCFGLVVGPRKFQWHYRAGHDQDLFARMLVDVCRRAAPGLNILDAVVGMEGEGPTSGTPRPMGFLAAAADPFAMDAVCARIAGLAPADLSTLRAAGADGSQSWEDPPVAGAGVEELRITDLAFPQKRSFRDMGPAFLSNFMRGWFTGRPAAVDRLCTGCGTCARICPASAIEMRQKRPAIDTSACIRCYCCHELCPEHAMTIHKPLPARMIERIGRKRS